MEIVNRTAAQALLWDADYYPALSEVETLPHICLPKPGAVQLREVKPARQ
jgi:hypothetical protein